MNSFFNRPQVNQSDYLSVSFACAHNVGAGGVTNYGGIDPFILTRVANHKRLRQFNRRVRRALGGDV